MTFLLVKQEPECVMCKPLHLVPHDRPREAQTKAVYSCKKQGNGKEYEAPLEAIVIAFCEHVGMCLPVDHSLVSGCLLGL
jgi:hypothetical protein